MLHTSMERLFVMYKSNFVLQGHICDFSAFTFFLKAISVRLHAVPADAGPSGSREVLDGGSALSASAQLHGAVTVLRDDRATTATWSKRVNWDHLETSRHKLNSKHGFNHNKQHLRFLGRYEDDRQSQEMATQLKYLI